MATTYSYNQLGQHKDLSNIVTLLAPQDTPFQSVIGKTRVSNTLFNWVEEALNAADANNAQVEGGKPAAATGQDIKERSNYTQIFSRLVSVTGTSEYVDQAGSLEKLADQVSKRTREVKRDMEAAFLSSQVGAAGTSTTARKTAGFAAQVDAAHVIDKAGAAVTEDDVLEALVRIYEAGGTPDTIMCHPRVRVALTKAITDKSGRISDRGLQKKIVQSIQTYMSDVGDVAIFNNVHAAYDKEAKTGDIYIFDSSMWDVAFLRPFRVEDLAKDGDATNRLVLAEAGLKNRNFFSSAVIKNVLC